MRDRPARQGPAGSSLPGPRNPGKKGPASCKARLSGGNHGRDWPDALTPHGMLEASATTPGLPGPWGRRSAATRGALMGRTGYGMAGRLQKSPRNCRPVRSGVSSQSDLEAFLSMSSTSICSSSSTSSKILAPPCSSCRAAEKPDVRANAQSKPPSSRQPNRSVVRRQDPCRMVPQGMISDNRPRQTPPSNANSHECDIVQRFSRLATGP